MRDSAVSPEEVDKGARLVTGVGGLYLGLNFKRREKPQGEFSLQERSIRCWKLRDGVGVGQGCICKS